MSVEILKKNNKLILHYEPVSYPSPNNVSWIFNEFGSKGVCIFAHTFYLRDVYLDAYDQSELSYADFSIANLVSINNQNYFQIKSEILNIKFELYFEENCNINKSYFFTERQTSIFQIIDKMNLGEKIFIGGNEENAISEIDYIKIISALPNTYEHKLYDDSRVETVLRNYFCPTTDFETQFAKYLNSKKIKDTDLSQIHFEDFDIQRYSFLLTQLEQMLLHEDKYSEDNWQNEILKFIRILYPKYVISVKEAIIRKGIADKEKNIDILLGDYNGNIDIIEIKKPFGIELLNRQLYRENYIPTRALSGAIMQAEKYVYYLTKGGKKVEDDLNKQFAKIKPDDYTFKVVNPKTLIIMGRTNDYSPKQMEDLEIIKRKYKNVIDIISYDDLIQRLRTTIEMLKKEINI